MTAVPADKQILRAERARCRGLVQHAIGSTVFLGRSTEWTCDAVVALLRNVDKDIRVGKNPPVAKKKPSTCRVCSYCDGEIAPLGHNRATCPQRFADLAAGRPEGQAA